MTSFKKFLKQTLCYHHWCARRGNPYSLKKYAATCSKCNKISLVEGTRLDEIKEVYLQ